MGVNSSKDKLSQFVVIYGFDSNAFGWRDIDNRNVYHTTGLIIENQGCKYVVTTRSQLIHCRHIVMYYSSFDGAVVSISGKNTIFNTTVLRNDLRILFQSIEFNIIILGTKDKTFLDLSASELILGDQLPSHVHAHQLENYMIVPKKSTTYHTALMNMDLDSHYTNFETHIYHAKFVKSFINDETYLPSNYFYQFKLSNIDEANKENLVGINGAMVFNKQHQVIGMVSSSRGKYLEVLPYKALAKIVRDFFTTNQDNYSGLYILPIIPKIMVFETDKKKDYQPPGCSSRSTSNVESKLMIEKSYLTKDSQPLLRENDEIIQVNGLPILLENDSIKIWDSDYKDHLPLDLYLRLNLTKDTTIKMLVRGSRKNPRIKGNGEPNLFELSDIKGSPLNHFIFPISSRPYFYPTNSISYSNIRGLIITELTHELIDICACHQIVLTNDIIEMIYREGIPDCQQFLVILDCLSQELIDKYHLPCLTCDRKRVIPIPIIYQVNENKVSTLADVSSLHDNLVSLELKVGLSKEECTLIKI